MVLMGGSKMARHQCSIVNRANCGGIKKSGLAPTFGIHVPGDVRLARATSTQWIGGLPPICVPHRNQNVNQRIGYSATLGMM